MRFEIHAHSMYSNIRLIDSINKPIDLIKRASELGLAGITLTDHEALCGHIEWLQLEKQLKKDGAIEEDFVCALGNEIYLVDSREGNTYFPHLILIAKNEKGHRALRELSSIAWYNSFHQKGMERVPTTKEELARIVEKYPNSLICSSACLGSELAHLTMELIELEKTSNIDEIYKKKVEIVRLFNFFKKLFGDDYYVEVAPSASKDQILYNKEIKRIAKAQGIKLVFGGDAHYLSKEDRFIHKAFLNSKNGEREVDDFYSYAYLMDDEEAFLNCAGVFTKEEFDEICANSIEIMNKISHYSLEHSPIIPITEVFDYGYNNDTSLIKYNTLYNLMKRGSVQARYWVNQCLEGLRRIDKYNDIYLSRLEEEADVINVVGNKLGNDLFAYFNTFQSYINLFWENGSIVGPGRGSSVCFLSNYLLGITQLDPIEYELPSFRFLNKDRLELPDIDIDLSPSKREKIFESIRKKIGETNLLQVATFTTVGTKSAVLTACRGYRSKKYPNGIDIDEAQYIANLIPQERGFLWSLSDMIYGNEEKDRKPSTAFINEVKKYDGLLKIMFGIDGLITTRSQHASGVIIYNESCCDTGALMRSPGGQLTTQYSLHHAEAAGDTKFDFLVTEICDKLITTVNLLQKDEYFDKSLSLKEIYDEYLHPSKLDITDTKIWDALGDGSVLDVFQFSTQVGLQAATTIKPRNPHEMMMANALTRLVGEKGKERPIDRYVRLRSNMDYWYREVNDRGLNRDDIEKLKKFYLPTFGCPTTQEKLMLICMDIAKFSLKDANAARKIVAKKQINKVEDLKKQFFEGCGSKVLADYVWDTCMAPQMSYSFAEPHALAYSFVGIQVLYLATSYPSLYWNCACLISDCGSVELSQEDDGLYVDYAPLEKYSNEMASFDLDEDNENDIVDSYDEEEDCDGYPAEIVIMQDGKKKKRVKATNYGKVAVAIGRIIQEGIVVSPPDINKSSYTFTPDLEENSIRYGLSGITRIGEDKVKEIFEARPYVGIEDFLNKVKVNKPQMANLIKSGAFDKFGDRKEVMRQYIASCSDQKKRVTLQNMKMLIDFKLLPEELDFECKIFNFNKYIKKFKYDKYYILNEYAYNFYENNFSIDDLIFSSDVEGAEALIIQTKWDKIYKKYMDNARTYIKAHHDELLEQMNNRLMSDMWNKYCKGSLSKWEMDSISYYEHEHELLNADLDEYGCVDYFNLPDEPIIERRFFKDGKEIILYKIMRIAGTVLDKDKNKGLITLLTTTGVVNVKMYGPIFSVYDKQISEKGADGKKHVVEKSWLSRGNKIIISGIKRDNNFIAKKYKNSPFHLVELITDIDDYGNVITQQERCNVE